MSLCLIIIPKKEDPSTNLISFHTLIIHKRFINYSFEKSNIKLCKHVFINKYIFYPQTLI